MKITERIALEIASHEAITRSAYLDRVASPDIWTWSVGVTHKTGHDVTRYKDKPQSLEHCLTIYIWALDKFAETVRREFARTTLTEAQFGALLSFAYNAGPATLSRATWIKDFRRGDIAAARKNIMNWVHAGGKRVPGLVTRREKERNLFFDGKWSSDGTILEYQVNSDYRPVKPRRIDIRAPMRAALARHYGSAPVPVEPPPSPTPSPPPSPAPDGAPSAEKALVRLIAAALVGLTTYVAGGDAMQAARQWLDIDCECPAPTAALPDDPPIIVPRPRPEVQP